MPGALLNEDHVVFIYLEGLIVHRHLRTTNEDENVFRMINVLVFFYFFLYQYDEAA
jgi:hypothetical protein